MSEVGHKLCCIRTICSMNGETFSSRDKTKNVISGYGFAAVGKIVNDFITAFSEYNQLGIFFIQGMRNAVNFNFMDLYRLRCLNPVSIYFKIFQFLQVNVFHSYLIKKIQR